MIRIFKKSFWIEFWNQYLKNQVHHPLFFMVPFLSTLLDAFIVIIPSDFVLIFSILAVPSKGLQFVIASCLGGIISQMVFYFLSFEYSNLIFSYFNYFFDSESILQIVMPWLHDWGAVIIAPIGLSPLPMQIAVIACGLANIAFYKVLFFLTLARVLRFSVIFGFVKLGIFEYKKWFK